MQPETVGVVYLTPLLMLDKVGERKKDGGEWVSG